VAGEVQVACSLCGALAADGAPLEWSTSASRTGTQLLCEVCTREHLRSIEAKLAEAWW